MDEEREGEGKISCFYTWLFSLDRFFFESSLEGGGGGVGKLARRRLVSLPFPIGLRLVIR